MPFLQPLLHSRFVRDIATMQVGRTVMIGCSFLSSIIYARMLGLGGYGEYAVVLAFTGTFGLFTNLGQQITTLTFFAEAYGRKDRTALAQILQYYLVLSACTALLLGLFAFFSPALTALIYKDSSVGQLARIVFLSSICELVFVYFSIALQTVRNIRLLTLLENAKTVLQLGLATWFLLLGYGVAGILWSWLIAAASFSALSCMLYPKLRADYDLPRVSEALSAGNKAALWKRTKDGLWIAADKSLGNLYPNIFLFVLSTQVQEAVVGSLRLAFKLGGLPASFGLASVGRLASSVIPTFAGRGRNILRRELRRLTTHTMAMHGFITLCGLLIVPPLLPMVYGEHFGIAVYPFIVIAVLNLSLAFHAIATPILRVYSKIWIAAVLSATGTLVGLGLFFYLLEQMLKPTWALYSALLGYHLIAILVFVPVVKIMKSTSEQK